jgi:hypothetical protein
MKILLEDFNIKLETENIFNQPSGMIVHMKLMIILGLE